MSNSNITTFLTAANVAQNPSPTCTHAMEIRSDQLDFEDLLLLADADHKTNKETAASFSCLKPSTTLSRDPFISSSHENEIMTISSVNGCSWEVPSSNSCADYMLQRNESYVKTVEREDVGTFKIAFRTQSALEIMDDGYKWRKYGKKKVKNNPNPRNYYKCLTTGCKVKKRVEREREDPRFVITTYEGKHNHESPGATPAVDISHTNNALKLPSAPHTLQILRQP